MYYEDQPSASHNIVTLAYLTWLPFEGLLLFYAIATVFLLYYGGVMMYEMRRIKREPTLLPTQGIFNQLSYHLPTTILNVSQNKVNTQSSTKIYLASLLDHNQMIGQAK